MRGAELGARERVPEARWGASDERPAEDVLPEGRVACVSRGGADDDDTARVLSGDLHLEDATEGPACPQAGDDLTRCTGFVEDRPWSAAGSIDGIA